MRFDKNYVNLFYCDVQRFLVFNDINFSQILMNVSGTFCMLRTISTICSKCAVKTCSTLNY